MATLTVYENGCSAGRGNKAPSGGLRGKVDGWSPSAARRHKQWLWSVQTERLDGIGAAVTLTLRDVPESHTEWVALVDRLYRAFRDADLLRWCHVVEWQWGGQGRGAPHLHLAVYVRDGHPISDIGAWVITTWLRLAAPYGVAEVAQDTKPIDGPRGWLEYLSKHSGRTARHYQRQGKPPGWESTGRVYRHGGDWPIGEPLRLDLDEGSRTFHRFRRLVRSMVIADARAQVLAARPGSRAHRDAVKRLRWARRMLRNADPSRSAARGVGEWMPGQDVTLALALCAGWSGEVMA